MQKTKESERLKKVEGERKRMQEEAKLEVIGQLRQEVKDRR